MDDSNRIAVVPPAGWKYDRTQKKLIECEGENENEDDQPEDERMAKVLVEIANDVMDCIKMEVDTPSRNQDEKLPILDMKVWTSADGNVAFQHYEKAVSSKAVLHAQSAHPSACKRSVHVQETVRRPLNSVKIFCAIFNNTKHKIKAY